MQRSPEGFGTNQKRTAKFRDKWCDESLGVKQSDVAVRGEPGKLGRGNTKVTCNTLFSHMLEIFHNKKLQRKKWQETRVQGGSEEVDRESRDFKEISCHPQQKLEWGFVTLERHGQPLNQTSHVGWAAYILHCLRIGPNVPPSCEVGSQTNREVFSSRSSDLLLLLRTLGCSVGPQVCAGHRKQTCYLPHMQSAEPEPAHAKLQTQLGLPWQFSG